MTATVLTPTPRTTLKRLPKRGHFDRELIHSILDEALIAHVGFVADGAPVVIPTIHWRHEETLYLHGSAASRMLRSLRDGVEACVTVTLLDGLVLARSAFHHSMNYRSVVVFGTARLVDDEGEKRLALDSLVEHVVRGRSAEVRAPNAIEMKQTMVLALPIEEASAKVRTGGPVDDDEDYALPVWAGVVPARLTFADPIRDERSAAELPDYLIDLRVRGQD